MFQSVNTLLHFKNNFYTAKIHLLILPIIDILNFYDFWSSLIPQIIQVLSHVDSAGQEHKIAVLPFEQDDRYSLLPFHLKSYSW